MDEVSKVASYTEPMEYVSRILRNVGDSCVVNLSVRLTYKQNFEYFSGLVWERLKWKLNCNQVIRNRDNGYRFIYLCTATRGY